MKIPFEDMDEDLMQNSEQVLSTAEKTLLILGQGIVKLITWRVKRAKTYGDLYNIITFFKRKTEAIEEKMGNLENSSTDKQVDTILEEVQNFQDDLEEDNDRINYESPTARRGFFS